AHHGAGLSSVVRLLVRAVADPRTGGARSALRIVRRKLRERDPRDRRVPAAPLARLAAPARATREGKGIHQHAQLLSGRAARELEVGWALARLRAAPAPRDYARAALPRALGLRGVRRGAGRVDEQQVGGEDVLVTRGRSEPFVLIHPVRREYEQPAGARSDVEPELREARFTSAAHVVEIPEHHEVAARQMIDGIEVDLEPLLLPRVTTRPIALHDQVGELRRVGHRDREPDVAVVALERLVDLHAEEGREAGVREARNVELGPGGFLEPTPQRAAIHLLETLQAV